MTRISKVNENHIKSQVKKYLDMRGIFSFHIMQGLGSYPGIPDRIAFIRGAVMIELKKPGGKQSDNQIAFQKQCEADGIPYWLIDNIEDLVNKVEERLA